MNLINCLAKEALVEGIERPEIPPLPPLEAIEARIPEDTPEADREELRELQ